jgi:hypothetical protein
MSDVLVVERGNWNRCVGWKAGRGWRPGLGPHPLVFNGQFVAWEAADPEHRGEEVARGRAEKRGPPLTRSQAPSFMSYEWRPLEVKVGGVLEPTTRRQP